MYPDNLTVNADDFGIDPGISRGIFECISRGWINSISVVPFTDSATESLLRTITEKHPRVAIGCHLSLIDTDPLLSDTPLYSSSQKSPYNYRQFLRIYLSGKFPGSSIYREWREQIKKITDLGINVGHVDSHQHLHILPGLWPIAKKLQQEFSIPHLRVPFESLRRSLFLHFPFGLFFQLLAWFRLREKGNRVFFGFVHGMNFQFQSYKKYFDRVLLQPDTHFELMVHPGYPPEAKDSPLSYWNASWENEIRQLGLTAEYFSVNRVPAAN
ncbi:ChbG/HpnK family deacetylase [Fibrobacterota bacterium]